ncbi:putative cysteine-rich receptor-like protein kinase 9 [Brachypodium distachyon]|uniref:Gnk2-homologous domain-containing protein n=1 Tax=Brachypodium distachyon TaxID=15368 RepID=A0A0Q3EE40_BRADI|nr:putative cysteine-rich receptor-like protein kinase 9 [Brachypodium distachyon]KQJ85895.1 hypothetical protein BRADI_4g02312v3 [Brachypodium distachyon]|eukprot:XP_024318871.1 putative cysteine-rich receptor-like protein kinase 9 [Brachypodium distachyon]
MVTAPWLLVQLLLLLLLTLVISSSLVHVAGAEGQTYWPLHPYCSTTGNYAGDTLSNRGFYNASVGEAPDEVFGLVGCYADRSWTQCHDCLYAAAAGIQSSCPFSREMKGAYDACVLSYSNVSSFVSSGVADLDVAFYTWNDSYVDDHVSMNQTRWKLLVDQLAPRASRSELRFANATVPYAETTMYGLAQCTRDLVAGECYRCLTKSVANLSSRLPNNTYGGIKGYGCYAIYSTRESLPVTVPPPLAPPLPSNLPPPLAQMPPSSNVPPPG